MATSKLPGDWYQKSPEDRERWLASYIADTSIEIDRLNKQLVTTVPTVIVDGVVKTLKWKVITPETPGAPADTGTSGTISIAHGLDATKFFTVIAQLFYTPQPIYIYLQEASGTVAQMYASNDGTNVYLTGLNSGYNSMPYKITIGYYE